MSEKYHFRTHAPQQIELFALVGGKSSIFVGALRSAEAFGKIGRASLDSFGGWDKLALITAEKIENNPGRK